MPANIIQAKLIQRYADRHSMDLESAARLWIPRKARAFRAWFNRHYRSINANS